MPKTRKCLKLFLLCFFLLHAPLRAATLDEAKAALGKLAGLGQLAGSALVQDGGAFKLGQPPAGVQVWLVNGAGGSWQAIVLPGPDARIDANDVLPGVGAEVFGDARLTLSAIVVSTADAGADPGAWPAALKAALAGYGGLSLKAGANGYLKVVPGSGGLVGQVKTAIGLGNDSLRVFGSTGPALLAKLLGGKAAAAAAPAPWEITVDFPAATPPVFASLGNNAPFGVRFESTRVKLRGEGAVFTASGQQAVRVRILEKELAVDNKLSFSKAGKAWAIACEGAVDADANLIGTAAIGFSVRKLILSGDLAASTSGAGRKLQGFGMGIGAQVDVAGAGTLRGDFDVDIAGKQVREFSLGLQGIGGAGIRLGGLPGIKELPGAGEFSFSKLGIGVRPVDKQAFLYGDLAWPARQIQAEAALLFGNKELALFFKGAGLSLRKLSPAIPAELDVIPLDKAMLVISRGKLENMAPSMLPSPVTAMIDAISGGSGGKVSFSDGLTVLTSFTPSGALKEPFALIGLGAKPLMLAGSIGGVFRGDPSFSFAADLGSDPLPAKRPAFIKPRGAAPKLFLTARDLKSKPALDAGIEGGVAMVLGGDTLELGLRTYATVGQTGAGLRATGRMDGLWRDPLGLKTLSVADLVLGFGIDADSTVTLSMGGKLAIDQYNYDSQMTLGVMAATGAPKKFGLLFSGSELSPRVQLKLMEIFMRSAASGPLASALPPADQQRLGKLMAGPSLTEHASKNIPIDLVRVKDVRVFMATPGASDPDLPGLQGMGIGLKGTLLLDNKLAGKVDSYVTDIDGMKLAGSIADFSIPGFLSLKDARLDVKVPMPLQGLPYFKMKGQSTVLLNKGLLDIELSLAKIKFISQSDWGAFGYANIHAESFGPSLLKPTDFILEMEAGADLKNGIRKQLVPAINGMLAAASKEDQRRLKEAQSEMAGLQADLDKTRKAASKNKSSAADAIDDAKKAVKKWKGRYGDVKDDIKSTRKAINKAKDEVRLDRAAELGIKLGALYVKKEGINASYKVAKASLAAAKKITGAVPTDLYPEVAAAKLAVDAKQTEIDSIKLGKQANKDLTALSKAISEGAKNIPIAIEEFSFKNGKMSSALRGEPQLVTLKMKISLPGRRPFRMTEQIELNLLNPAAMDLEAVAAQIGDAIEDTAGEIDEALEGIELL